VRYQGREIDPLKLWADYVDFPANMDTSGPFLPLVRCPNPNHDTLKRHFQINIEKPLVHCFAGCGISGTYEHALSIVTGLDARSCRRLVLRAKSRTQTVRKRNRGSVGGSRPISNAAIPDFAISSYIPQAGIDYLARRGIDGRDIAKWELAWDEDDLRIVIPVRDHNGKLRFHIRRATRPNDWPKYLYPDDSERSRWIFGACAIHTGMIRSHGMIVCEGSLDAIRLNRHGLPAVAILGTYMSEEQARIISNLRPRKLYLMYDKDVAGVQAIERTRKWIRSIPIYICRYPKGRSDPAELTENEALRSVQRAIPYFKFAQIAKL